MPMIHLSRQAMQQMPEDMIRRLRAAAQRRSEDGIVLEGRDFDAVMRGESPPAPASLDLATYFDRVVVISLERTPDRLRDFWARFPSDWPFRRPEWFKAVDGTKLPVPKTWAVGGPAWGCHSSHETVLRDAICAGARRLLVLEDDAACCDGFTAKVEAFLRTVPPDWEQLMLGGQQMHDGKKTEVSAGVFRVNQHERTHAYAVQGEGLRSLYQMWTECATGHCDWTMGDWQGGHRVYAPEVPLLAQAENFSTIRYRREGERWWDGAPGRRRDAAAVPVVVLRCSAAVLARLSTAGEVCAASLGTPLGDALSRVLSAVRGPVSSGMLKPLHASLVAEAQTMSKAVAAFWEPSQARKLGEYTEVKLPDNWADALATLQEVRDRHARR